MNVIMKFVNLSMPFGAVVRGNRRWRLFPGLFWPGHTNTTNERKSLAREVREREREKDGQRYADSHGDVGAPQPGDEKGRHVVERAERILLGDRVDPRAVDGAAKQARRRIAPQRHV